MYGANLRQTSTNAKTLESGMYFWAVLKLWMAKTFEKITLFVKTISAIFLCTAVPSAAADEKIQKMHRKQKGKIPESMYFHFQRSGHAFESEMEKYKSKGIPGPRF